jgi:hypothetical protein
MTLVGLPHSEILGSTLACSSPRLIAADHVLHRLLMPRHPPCALSSLTIGTEERGFRRDKLWGNNFPAEDQGSGHARNLGDG